MLSIFTDSLPKPILAAAAIWAGLSYSVTGPEAGTRIARADYLPVCEAGFSAMVADAGVERLRSLPVPSLDPMQQFALSQVQRLQSNPFMDQLRGTSGGMGDVFGISEAADAAMAQMNHAQRSARESRWRASCGASPRSLAFRITVRLPAICRARVEDRRAWRRHRGRRQQDQLRSPGSRAAPRYSRPWQAG